MVSGYVKCPSIFSRSSHASRNKNPLAFPSWIRQRTALRPAGTRDVTAPCAGGHTATLSEPGDEPDHKHACPSK